MATEEECVTCQISTIKAADKNKMPRTPMTKPRQTIFMDILHLQSGNHLTPDSTFAFLLIMVDAYARFTKTYGLDDKTTESVIKAIRQYIADCGSVDEFGYNDIVKIHSDAGTQFSSMEFQDFCRDEQINLSLAAPEKQVRIILQNILGKLLTIWHVP
jgi:transposase InsO family protein